MRNNRRAFAETCIDSWKFILKQLDQRRIHPEGCIDNWEECIAREVFKRLRPWFLTRVQKQLARKGICNPCGKMCKLCRQSKRVICRTVVNADKVKSSMAQLRHMGKWIQTMHENQLALEQHAFPVVLCDQSGCNNTVCPWYWPTTTVNGPNGSHDIDFVRSRIEWFDLTGDCPVFCKWCIARSFAHNSILPKDLAETSRSSSGLSGCSLETEQLYLTTTVVCNASSSSTSVVDSTTSPSCLSE